MAIVALWTSRALLHLEAELDYYGKIAPVLAKELSMEVAVSIRKITDAPGIGRHGKKLGVREFILVQFPYVIAYRVRTSAIEVIGFIHQKRKNIKYYY